MILKETLRAIVQIQRTSNAAADTGIERELREKIDIDLPFALVLSGIRRCGKSTLLRQLMKEAKQYYYFNFEDPRGTGFESSDFLKLDDIFTEEYGRQNHYFFDEIQNIDKWELGVRYLLEQKKHVIITGSNASLLSKELGTRLTGRHLRFELFPFSYSEFLVFMKEKLAIQSFDEYLQKGGFPEFLKTNKSEALQELLSDLIARDIVVRHKLRTAKTIRDMAIFLLTNVGKEFSYTSLKKMFKLGSTNSVISFISYLEDSYLLFTIPKFEYSLKKQVVNPKKVYSIDNGLSNANSGSFSLDKGRMLENAVFLHLRRKNKDIYYFKQKHECDFVIKEKEKTLKAIQVCWELTEENKEREINGLTEALEALQLKNGLIITHHQEDVIETQGKTIYIEPAWKWMYEK
ncbi:MAG: ATP-binding protein [archaeon]